MAHIKVALRVRPLTTKEAVQHQTTQMSNTVLRVEGGNTVKLKSPWADAGDFHQHSVRRFDFDYCHWSVDPLDAHYASQQTVFNDIGSQVLDALFAGYNACVLAYGQSGTGKTYTMIGTESDPGLTPRLCAAVFDRIGQSEAAHWSYKVQISFMEIYNEKVRDLLDAAAVSKQLRVREHPKSGPYVQDLSRHAVADAETCLNLLSAGMKRRTSAPNAHQRHSSRSHAVFTIHLAAAQISGQMPKETSAKVHLVDLAGRDDSERAGRDLSRLRLKEGATINKSLATLGNVINALAERSSLSAGSSLRSSSSTCSLSSPSVASASTVATSTSVHNTPACSPRRVRVPFIPYRNSVLTWLLKDSLGGNSRTFMVAAVSPSGLAYKETLSTLRFAQRAQHVVNVPVVNESAAPKLIRHLQEEVARLKSVLSTVAIRSLADASPVQSESISRLMSANETRGRQLTEDWLLNWRSECESTAPDRFLRTSKSSEIGVQTSLPWLVNQQCEAAASTSTRGAIEDSSADLIPVKEVSREFWLLDDDDSAEMMMLHAFDRTEEVGLPPSRTNPSDSEADWSEDSLDASHPQNEDVEADSLDESVAHREVERSPTPMKMHRRIHARRPAQPKPHVRTIFPGRSCSPQTAQVKDAASAVKLSETIDRSIKEGERLVTKLNSLVERLSIAGQNSAHSFHRGHGHHDCLDLRRCCHHLHSSCGVHRCHPIPQQIHLCDESLWQFRRRLLHARRQLVARTASENVRKHLPYLRKNDEGLLPGEKWV